MDIASYWRDFWRHMEYSFSQLWDYVKNEAVEHPFMAVAIALIPLVLWRLLKGKN